MQLPNEMWFIIFRMRTKMILTEHYNCWLQKYKDFNKRIAEDISRLYYGRNLDYHFRYGPPHKIFYASNIYKRFWSRPFVLPYAIKRYDLSNNKKNRLIWVENDVKIDYIYDANGEYIKIKN